jgi:ribosomal protein S18 acetylase RimI-like enzyme
MILKRTLMNFRYAVTADVPALALMNQQLIRDEGHRNPMNLEQLQARMGKFIQSDYKAILAEQDGVVCGYALIRYEEQYVYVRQLFVTVEHRNKGMGRAIIDWLRANAMQGRPQIRIDVLIGNQSGIAFWHAIGFSDYSLCMESP